MRKHKHEPWFTKEGREWPVDDDGHAVPPPRRRAHGIFTDVAPTPKMHESAAKRARLYMHAAARRRFEQASAPAPVALTWEA